VVGGQDPQQTVLLRCACGWEARGTEDDVIAATQDHGRRVHNMEASHAEIMAMIDRSGRQVEAGDSPDGA
jgi:hypothetical protein